MRKAIGKSFEAPTGPITLEITIDFQTAIIPDSEIVQMKGAKPHSGVGEAVIAALIMEKIPAASRPVIWAGGGVLNPVLPKK